MWGRLGESPAWHGPASGGYHPRRVPPVAPGAAPARAKGGRPCGQEAVARGLSRGAAVPRYMGVGAGGEGGHFSYAAVAHGGRSPLVYLTP